MTEPIQASAPQIRYAMSILSADQGDAMAIQVETLHQQKEKYKEQCKAVLAQKESEFAVAKAQIQKEFILKQAEHQEHVENMESHINEVASNQEAYNQKGQRDLELNAQELQAKNAALEHKFFAKKNSKAKQKLYLPRKDGFRNN